MTSFLLNRFFHAPTIQATVTFFIATTLWVVVSDELVAGMFNER